jgi:hypothetical protein
MRPTAPDKEITAQALGAAFVAFLFGVVAWVLPEVPPPPAGLEAGAAVIAGYIVALVRKQIARRKMTEKENAADKALQSGRVSIE